MPSIPVPKNDYIPLPDEVREFLNLEKCPLCLSKIEIPAMVYCYPLYDYNGLSAPSPGKRFTLSGNCYTDKNLSANGWPHYHCDYLCKEYISGWQCYLDSENIKFFKNEHLYSVYTDYLSGSSKQIDCQSLYLYSTEHAFELLADFYNDFPFDFGNINLAEYGEIAETIRLFK